MPRTTKNTLRLTFDPGVKQSTFVRKLGPGDFTSLKNVRRPDDGPPEKRTGYDRTTVDTFVGTSYVGPATELVASDTLMWRDARGQIWNAQGSTGYYRGTDRGHVVPSYQQLENITAEGRAHKPLQVVRAGTELWQFSMGIFGGGIAGYQVSVFDATTRQPLREAEVVAATGIVSWTAVVDADDTVWLFFIRSDTRDVVMAHQYTDYAATAAETTYATLTGYELTSIDARLIAVPGEVVVAATSLEGAAADPHIATLWWSYLDTVTGAAAVSPTPGTQTQTTTDALSELRVCNGVSILDSDGSDGFFRLAYYRITTGAQVELRRVQVDTTTLAVDETSQLYYEDLPLDGDGLIGVSAGYMDGTDEVWASTLLQIMDRDDLNVRPSGYTTGVSSAVTYHHVYNGSSTTTTDLARSSYLAGRPVQVGTDWYWVLGFQDNDRAQRGYFLHDASGNLLTPILDGEGAEVFHAGGLAGGFGGQTYTYDLFSGHVVNPEVVDGQILVPLLREGLTAVSPAPAIVTISFDETFTSTAPGVIPGGIPKRVSVQDELVELSPVHFPYEPLRIQDNGTEVTEHSANVCAYRYLTQGSDGRIYVSSPSALQTLTFLNYTSPDTTYTVRVPTLRHTIGQTFIALYGSADGATDPFLQRVIPNDPTEDYIDLDVAPQAWADTGETLETLGNALDQATLPPCRIAFVHRDRVVLAGTPDDTVWPSQEFESGRGPEFNEALAFAWGKGTGEVTAGCSISDDAFVLFREDAVGIVAGPGPDGNGQNGAYQVATVPAKLGTTNPATVVAAPYGAAGPAGVFFQADQDSRFYWTGGSAPLDVSAGIEDYLAETVTAAVHDAASRVVRFYCASGKKLILDYARPLPDQPAGQWYVDEGDGLNAAVAAAVIAGEPVALEAGDASEATTFKPGTGYLDDGEEILTDYVMGPLAPGGMLGELDTHRCQISSTNLGGDSTFEYVFTDDEGNDETHEDDGDGSDVAFMTGLDRTREFYIRFRETAATGRGRRLDGVALVVGVYARGLQNPRRRIG